MPRLLRLSPSVVSWLRLLAVGAVLAAVASSLVWRVIDARLVAEARRRALAGESRAVALSRDDWATILVPVALLEPDHVGAEARKAVSAMVNVEVTRGDRRSLGALTIEVLDALRDAKGVPTDEGARWGEWLAKHLANVAERLPPEDRIAVLADADAALTRLASIPRQPPTEVVAATPPTPVLEPETEEEPPSETLVATTPPVAVEPLAVTPEPAPFAPAPADFDEQPISPTPDPLSPAKKDLVWGAPQEDLAGPEPDAESATPAELADRALLAEGLRLETLLPIEPKGPRASGPTTIRSEAADDGYVDVRRRLNLVRFELHKRGYAAVSVAQVKSLISSEMRDRLALAERCLTDSTGDPARVLLALASDESAEVRAAAVSALGSSTSRPLVERALKFATEDSDLRVGRLAEPIRERLR